MSWSPKAHDVGPDVPGPIGGASVLVLLFGATPCGGISLWFSVLVARGFDFGFRSVRCLHPESSCPAPLFALPRFWVFLWPASRVFLRHFSSSEWLSTVELLF